MSIYDQLKRKEIGLALTYPCSSGAVGEPERIGGEKIRKAAERRNSYSVLLENTPVGSISWRFHSDAGFRD